MVNVHFRMFNVQALTFLCFIGLFSYDLAVAQALQSSERMQEITLAEEKFSETIDAGTIGNQVFEDVNTNGLQDLNELGIPDIPVFLYNANNLSLPIASTTTDSSGFYLFDELNTSADYVLQFIEPVGYSMTQMGNGANNGNPLDSDADPATGFTETIELEAGENDLTIDVGFVVEAAIVAGVGDYVFVDLNENGIQDGTDYGLGGVNVYLFDVNNLFTPIQSTTTYNSGYYEFIISDVEIEYVIEFYTPDGYKPTAEGAGATMGNTIDSDANASTGLTEPLILSPFQFNNTIDAGFIPLTDTETTADDTADSATEASTETTTEDGSLDASTDEITDISTEDGTTETTTDDGTTDSSTDAGTEGGTDSGETNTGLSGYIYNDANYNTNYETDENPIGGIEVVILGGSEPISLFSNIDGFYEISNLAPDNYAVFVNTAPNGYGLTGDYSLFVPVTAGEISTDNNFGFTANSISTGKLKGRVLLDTNGDGIINDTDQLLAGVQVTILHSDGSFESLQTGFDGTYSLGSLINSEFSISVVEILADGSTILTEQTQTVTIVDGETISDIDFLYENDSSSDSTTEASTEITTEDGSLDTSTDEIADISTEDGTTETTTDDGTTDSSTDTGTEGGTDSGETNTGLSGYIYNDANYNTNYETNENPIGGIEVTIIGGSEPISLFSNIDGFYEVANLAPDNYSVLVNTGPNGYGLTGDYSLFVPVTAGEISTDNNFGFTANSISTGELTGRVLLDTNGDGIINDTDQLLAGVQVTILHSDGSFESLQTGFDGTYSLGSLINSEFSISVAEILADGSTILTEQIKTVTIVDGETISDIDFLYENDEYDDENGTINGTVFIDLNGDGLKDEIEYGAIGVQMILSNGAEAWNTTSDTDGNYSFPYLASGFYQLFVGQGPVGTSLSTASSYNVEVLNSATADGFDFGFVLNNETPIDNFDGKISGYVWIDINGNGEINPGELPIANQFVTIQYATGANLSIPTDENGYYLFENLGAGNYQVLAGNGPNETIITTNVAYNIPLANSQISTGNNFGYQPQSPILDSSISGFVWKDTNENGSIDLDEEALSGIEIELSAADGSTTTSISNQNGFYLFENLLTEIYTLNVLNVSEEMNFTTPTNYTIQLYEGEDATNYNFGFSEEESNNDNCENAIICDLETFCTEPMTAVQFCLENCVNSAMVSFAYTSQYHCNVTELESGCFEYIPLPGIENYNDFDVVMVTSIHENGECTETELNIYIGDCENNTAPIAANDVVTTAQNTSILIAVLVNDTDAENQLLTICGETTLPENGTILVQNNQLIYTPNTDFAGNDNFDYTICDSEGATATATVFVIVEAIDNGGSGIECENELLELCIAPMTAIEFCPEFCALEEESYTIQSVESTYHCSIDEIGNNCLRYLPLPGLLGQDFVQVIACGEVSSLCDTLMVAIFIGECEPILETNTEPTANDDNYSINEGVSLVMSTILNDSDADGDLLSICGNTLPMNGTISETNTGFVYTPNEGFAGIDSFLYNICDGNGGEDVAIITITINELEELCNPNQSVCTEQFTPIEICIDFCNETASIESAQTTFNCSLQFQSTSCIRYVPLPAFLGTDVIEIIGCDEQGNCEVVEVNMYVGDCSAAASSNTLANELNQSKIEDANELRIPNAFSPNADGINDFFYLKNLAELFPYQSVEMAIFDVEGFVVFTSKGTGATINAWDGCYSTGAIVPEGAYFYCLEIGEGDEAQQKTGHISIRR